MAGSAHFPVAGPMSLRQTFGRNVRLARQERGLTIEALADAAGLSYSYVGELERGRRNPTLAVVERLSVALKSPTHRLLMPPVDNRQIAM
ncbi:transcriptional regulator, PvuIIC family protein [Brevundimonas diminuta 470-4]|nr:transcriptional regulator, PvuIIC family protein [Brevundimonas diminuta 470-4]